MSSPILKYLHFYFKKSPSNHFQHLSFLEIFLIFLRADEGAVVYIHPQTQVNKFKNKRMYASTGLEVKPKRAEKSRKDSPLQNTYFKIPIPKYLHPYLNGLFVPLKDVIHSASHFYGHIPLFA